MYSVKVEDNSIFSPYLRLFHSKRFNHYKNFQFDQNRGGDKGFYNTTPITYVPLRLAIPETKDLALIINPSPVANAETSTPLAIQYSWELKKYLRNAQTEIFPLIRNHMMIFYWQFPDHH